MRCYYHADREAVAVCSHCGKALCRDCADMFHPCMCVQCFNYEQDKLLMAQKAEQDRVAAEQQEQRNAELGAFVIHAAVGALIALFVLVYLRRSLESSGGVWLVLLMALFGFCAPFGWGTITHFVSTRDDGGSSFIVFGIASILLLWLKAMFSFIIGVPCFSYQLVALLLHFRSDRKMLPDYRNSRP